MAGAACAGVGVGAWGRNPTRSWHELERVERVGFVIASAAPNRALRCKCAWATRTAPAHTRMPRTSAEQYDSGRYLHVAHPWQRGAIRTWHIPGNGARHPCVMPCVAVLHAGLVLLQRASHNLADDTRTRSTCMGDGSEQAPCKPSTASAAAPCAPREPPSYLQCRRLGSQPLAALRYVEQQLL